LLLSNSAWRTERVSMRRSHIAGRAEFSSARAGPTDRRAEALPRAAGDGSSTSSPPAARRSISSCASNSSKAAQWIGQPRLRGPFAPGVSSLYSGIGRAGGAAIQRAC
jgi:hypothetical protein